MSKGGSIWISQYQYFYILLVNLIPFKFPSGPFEIKYEDERLRTSKVTFSWQFFKNKFSLLNLLFT